MNSLTGDAAMRPEAQAFRHLGRTTQQIREELGVDPVSVKPIRDPEVYELEREKLFKRTWLKVATDWEIPEKGDYKVKDMPVADTSVLIVRGKDGTQPGIGGEREAPLSGLRQVLGPAQDNPEIIAQRPGLAG